MKVYLGGSIHGGREFAESLKLICGHLEEMGYEVLTRDFVVNLNPALAVLEHEEIVGRDLSKVEEADVLIGEVSQGSHGFGFEHRHALGEGKPAILLRHMSLSSEGSRSAFLSGPKGRWPKSRFAYYNEGNIRGLLEGFFAEFFPEGRIVRERE